MMNNTFALSSLALSSIGPAASLDKIRLMKQKHLRVGDMVALAIGRFYGLALACVKECVSDSLLLIIRRYRASFWSIRRLSPS